MCSRFHCFLHFLIAMVLSLAAVAVQAQAPADPPPPATLCGQVSEPTGALHPGAEITITTPTGVTVKTATADASGGYVVRGLAPGSYIVRAAFAGFAPFQSQPIQLEAGHSKTLNIAMAIATAQQNVVEAENREPAARVEAERNATSEVLKGGDPNGLSGNPGELRNELKALSGPEAGPDGGQIYINGFMGRQLPSKSVIHKIRIKGPHCMKSCSGQQPQTDYYGR
ncbi:MAG: carboxypeptidase-like regulatory domain-containing protein [Acidobacteriota bacterium]